MAGDTANAGTAATAANDTVGSGRARENRLYRSIFDGVMGQRLAPGTRLPEATLCELFGCGRSTVRRVLQRLAQEHIVQLRPHRGAVVTVPTPQDTRQTFEARRALEAAIVTLVCQRATAADLLLLRRQLQDEQRALQATAPHSARPAWGRLASSFHLRLAELARNPALQRYLAEMVSRCSLIVALHQRPGHAQCEHDEHARIVACIERGDAAGAVALMDQHLHGLEDRLALDSAPAQCGLAQMLGLG